MPLNTEQRYEKLRRLRLAIAGPNFWFYLRHNYGTKQAETLRNIEPRLRENLEEAKALANELYRDARDERAKETEHG